MKKVVRAAQAMRINAVKIACINKAKTSLGIPLPMLTAALQKCYDEHFLPVWGYPVKLYNTKKARPSDWLFIYFDDADAAGAEGYHDLTHRGQPVSKVFVKTSLEDNVPVSVTASHELFEMVIDPIANLWAEATTRSACLKPHMSCSFIHSGRLGPQLYIWPMTRARWRLAARAMTAAHAGTPACA